jgi:hypothetical protein
MNWWNAVGLGRESGKTMIVPRYCCKSDENVLLDEEGYLADPESPANSFQEASAIAVSDLDAKEAWVLLGEPGIGKTTSLTAMRDRAQIKSGGQVIFVNLLSVESKEDLFRKAEGGQSANTHGYHGEAIELFLDGLDECTERQKLAVDWIQELVTDFRSFGQCRVRISCRTACWPGILQKRLGELCGPFGLWELLPLRKKDAADIASSKLGENGCTSFLDCIENQRLGAFASRPLTLMMLLGIWRENPDMRAMSRAELFENGLKALCMEQNETFQARGEISARSADELMCIASRVAALTLFCKKPFVLLPEDEPLASVHDATFSEVASLEDCGHGPFQIDQRAYRDALDTGLFSSRGARRLGWAHRSFQEYLAARYFAMKNAPPAQVISLLASPDDSKGRLAPQLHGFSSWLASIDGGFRKALLALEPLALLSCDPYTLTNEEKAKIFSNLLQRVDSEEMFDIDRLAIKSLGYPGLEELLYPILSDNSKGDVLRRISLDIAVECRPAKLKDLLVDKALDQKCSSQIRARCISSLHLMKSTESFKALAGLVGPGREPDPDDEILGNTILATWPGVLDGESLFGALSPPRNDHLWGSYRYALQSWIPENIDPEVLHCGLRWMLGLGDALFAERSFQEVMEGLLDLALNHSKDRNTLDLLADVISKRIRIMHHAIPNSLQAKAKAIFSAYPTRRRAIASTAIASLLSNPSLMLELLSGACPLIKPSDLKWLLSKYSSASDMRMLRALMKLIFWIADLRNHTTRSTVEGILLTSPLGIEAQAWLDAHDARTQGVTPTRFASATGKKSRAESDLSKEIAVITRKMEGPSAWLGVIGAILGRDGTPWDAMRLEIGDIEESPQFATLSDTQRQTILDLAESYCTEIDPGAFRLHGFRRFSYAEIGVYYALLLLASNGKLECLLQGKALLLRKWARTILKLHPLNGDDKVREVLVRTLMEVVPETVIELIEEEIRSEFSEKLSLIPEENLRLLWNTQVEKTCMRILQSTDTPIGIVDQLLQELLLRDSCSAVGWAKGQLSLDTWGTQDGYQRALVAAVALLRKSPTENWALVWGISQNNRDFGKDLLQAYAYKTHDHEYELLQALSDSSLGELYRWLIGEFPHEQDSPHLGTHEVTERDSVVELRDCIPRLLASRATLLACGVLASLAESFPDDPRMKWLLAESSKKTLEKSWEASDPLTARQLWGLIGDGRIRSITSEASLGNAIIEILEDLQDKLQGETPASRLLWNSDQETCWPKSEEDLSDLVKLYLEERLVDQRIVVNREVQIRRGMGSAIGQRTDIHVDLIPQDGSSGHLRAIIECKGCWNQNLATAMETQLRDRYLEDNCCKAGIFLVGYFDCTTWNRPKDSRRHGAHSLADLRNLLGNQARHLSSQTVWITSLVLDCTIR